MRRTATAAPNPEYQHDPVTAAEENLAQYRLIQSELLSQIDIPAGTPIDHRADWWLGFFEGTIRSLLTAMPKENS